MAKTLIDVDDDLLSRVASELGTKTKKDTVNQALGLVLRAAAFERAVEFARSGGFDDVLNPDVVKDAWR